MPFAGLKNLDWLMLLFETDFPFHQLLFRMVVFIDLTLLTSGTLAVGKDESWASNSSVDTGEMHSSLDLSRRMSPYRRSRSLDFFLTNIFNLHLVGDVSREPRVTRTIMSHSQIIKIVSSYY